MPTYFKINGSSTEKITAASGTFENVETIQFILDYNENYAGTVNSTILGLNLSANQSTLSEVYTLTQDVTDIVIDWEPRRSI